MARRAAHVLVAALALGSSLALAEPGAQTLEVGTAAARSGARGTGLWVVAPATGGGGGGKGCSA